MIRVVRRLADFAKFLFWLLYFTGVVIAWGLVIGAVLTRLLFRETVCQPHR